MKEFKDALADAQAKAATNSCNVFIYDDGQSFEIVLDKIDGSAGGQLSYVVYPDGTFILVDG